MQREYVNNMTVVEYETQEHIAIITLNRPEARNEMHPEMAVGFADAWQKAK